MIALAALLRLTQTMMVGGSSVTEHTAEQVKPATPCEPFVETMETVDATRDMASRNSAVVARVIVAEMDNWIWPSRRAFPSRDWTSVCVGIFLSLSLVGSADRRCTKKFSCCVVG